MLQCEHITGEGTRCFSPAMHRRPFCYLHWRLREHKLPITEPGFAMPIIDSEASVVLAASQIAHAVLSGQLEAKRARVILLSLRMAVDSFRRQQDVTHVTEIELTDSMHQQFAAEALAKQQHTLKPPAPQQVLSSPVAQPGLSSPRGRQSDEGSAVNLPSPAERSGPTYPLSNSSDADVEADIERLLHAINATPPTSERFMAESSM